MSTVTMAYLLDTHVVSELRKGSRCNSAVWEWFGALDEADAYLSVLVVGEIERGIERIRKRDSNPPRASAAGSPDYVLSSKTGSFP